jgi:hypothetical protein
MDDQATLDLIEELVRVVKNCDHWCTEDCYTCELIEKAELFLAERS